jgi:outer membrane protein assembly factor BamB
MNRHMPTSRATVRIHAASALVFCFLFMGAIGAEVFGATWPTYRCNVTRNAVTTEHLGSELSLQWSYCPLQPPKPAWPTPAEEMPRMHTDNAFHVAMAEGRVFFGSSVTDDIRAIDAATGQVCWTFFTDGPIRFAPTVHEGRLYVGSDDGYVYCLKVADGTLLWRYRPGPSDEKVIGNGRMISLWPIRTSVLVDRGVVYCGAGVFPYEGLYVCALDAEDGSVVWVNDTIGDRAHELAYGGISPHGYLLASKDVLYVPSGRAMPAGFSRRTGEFLFWAAPGGKQGGAWALLDENRLIAGVDRSGAPHKVAYDADTGRNSGDAFAWFPGLDMVLQDKMAYVLTASGVYAIDRKAHTRAVAEVNRSTAKRKALGQELVKLRKDLAEADAEKAQKMRTRIDEITSVTAGYLAQEKRLQNSCFTWHFPLEGFGTVALAGGTLFVGGQGRVIAVDVTTGQEAWNEDVMGTALGLAVADGRLVVSTDRGGLHCFAERRRASAPQEIKVARDPDPFRDRPQTQLYRAAARRMIDETKITKGYCLVLGANAGQLAYELARITDLQVVALEKDSEKLRDARVRLRAAGLLGVRVVVEPWDVEMLPLYFANLIVCDDEPSAGAAIPEPLQRVLRPSGGTVVACAPDRKNGLAWRTFRRPGLEGAGGWTQQYGNPQNTACSSDELAKGPLGVLWFGEPGPQAMVERHAKAQSPLSMNGRLFIQGEEVIMAVDAYNGTALWERRIPGAVRARADVDGGNLALDEKGLYVAAYDQCLRLDPATGATVRQYALPATGGQSYRWGCVSIENDTLVGVRAEPLKQPYAAQLTARHANPSDTTLWAYKRSNAKWLPMANYPAWENYKAEAGSVTDRMMVGDMVFALDPETGKPRWSWPGRRIANLTVSRGDGKVFFADSGLSEELKKRALDERRAFIQDGIYQETEKMRGAEKYEPSDIRLVTALDAQTGKKLWERPIDLTGCCGDAMGSAYQDDVLLFFGCVGNHDAYRFRERQLEYRRIVALSASTGDVLWSRPLNYRTRPVVMSDRIIIEPRACDLHTGVILMRTDPISGKQAPWEFLRPGHTCAITNASASALFYRSSCTAIYDLDRDAGVAMFGGIRPGCWINMIPASGVVLVPEASVGCTCSFPLRCSFALVNKPERVQPWTVFVGHTELDQRGRVVPTTFDKPVKHLAINLGAPADMKDDAGTLWLAYPNPRTVYSQNHFSNYGLKFDLNETIVAEMGYFCHDFKRDEVKGTGKPWLFTSGCLGLLRCEVPLLEKPFGRNTSLYTVRLGFRVRPGEASARRIFDIKLQGRTVAQDFDLAQATSNTDKAIIREFRDIAVKGNLVLELVPAASDRNEGNAPILNCIEIIRQDEASLARAF